MKLIDIVLLIVIGAAVLLAIRHMITGRKHGSCCSGSCENCSGCSVKNDDRAGDKR